MHGTAIKCMFSMTIFRYVLTSRVLSCYAYHMCVCAKAAGKRCAVHVARRLREEGGVSIAGMMWDGVVERSEGECTEGRNGQGTQGCLACFSVSVFQGGVLHRRQSLH